MRLRWSVSFSDAKRCWVLSYNDGSRDHQKVIPRGAASGHDGSSRRLAHLWGQHWLCERGLLSEEALRPTRYDGGDPR